MVGVSWTPVVNVFTRNSLSSARTPWTTSPLSSTQAADGST